MGGLYNLLQCLLSPIRRPITYTPFAIPPFCLRLRLEFIPAIEIKVEKKKLFYKFGI